MCFNAKLIVEDNSHHKYLLGKKTLKQHIPVQFWAMDTQWHILGDTMLKGNRKLSLQQAQIGTNIRLPDTMSSVFNDANATRWSKASPNKEWNDFDTRLDSQKFIICEIMRQRRCPKIASNSKKNKPTGGKPRCSREGHCVPNGVIKSNLRYNLWRLWRLVMHLDGTATPIYFEWQFRSKTNTISSLLFSECITYYGIANPCQR